MFAYLGLGDELIDEQVGGRTTKTYQYALGRVSQTTMAADGSKTAAIACPSTVGGAYTGTACNGVQDSVTTSVHPQDRENQGQLRYLLDACFLKHDVGLSTRATYESLIRNHIRPAPGPVPLAKLHRSAAKILEAVNGASTSL